jgi:hypothetical protein
MDLLVFSHRLIEVDFDQNFGHGVSPFWGMWLIAGKRMPWALRDRQRAGPQ